MRIRKRVFGLLAMVAGLALGIPPALAQSPSTPAGSAPAKPPAPGSNPFAKPAPGNSSGSSSSTPGSPGSPGSPAGKPASTQPAGASGQVANRPAPIRSVQLTAQINDIVKQLTAEASQIEVEKVEDTKINPVFDRPHPLVKNLPPDAAPLVLRRILTSFTGDIYGDAYVRWHLMESVKAATPKDLREHSSTLANMLRNMPPTLWLPGKREFQDEPQEIASRWHMLISKTNVTVGYPPFQRLFQGREALQYMSAEKRAEAEAALAEAETLRGQWKRITNTDAVQYNRRIRGGSYALRQFRAELGHMLVKSGEPDMLDVVVQEIGRQLANKQRAAFDLMSYLYVAAFDTSDDGLAQQYEPRILAKVARDIEAMARANDGYIVYRDGRDAQGKDVDPPGWVFNRERNFADYAFHLVYLLRSIQGVGTPTPPATPPAGATGAAPGTIPGAVPGAIPGAGAKPATTQPGGGK